MILDRIHWKFEITNGEQIDAKDFFAEFSRLLPDSKEVCIDVVDYRHVTDGTKILLAGFHADLAFDHTDKIWGLLFAQKRPVPGDDVAVLKNTLQRAVGSLRQLKTDGFSVPPIFDSKVLHFVVNDRAVAPNQPETLLRVLPLVESVLAPLAKGKFTITNDLNPKLRFNLTIRFDESQDFLNWLL